MDVAAGGSYGYRKERRVGKRSRSERSCSSEERRAGKRSRSERSSSSVSQQHKEETSLCLFAYGADKRTALYRVYAYPGKVKRRPKLEMVRIAPKADLFLANAVSLLSKVYLLGGRGPVDSLPPEPPRMCVLTGLGWILDPVHQPREEKEDLLSPKFFYYDTKRPGSSWIAGPDMTTGRSRLETVAVGGKLFVFGGTDRVDVDHPWAEVFDPTKGREGEWKPLARPPGPEGRMLEKDSHIYAVAWGEDKVFILVHNFIYDLVKGWEHWNHRFPNKPPPSNVNVCMRPGAVFLGNLLYWTGEGILYAYDMDTGRSYSGGIKGYRYRVKPVYPYDGVNFSFHHLDEPKLLHLGGNDLCVVHIDHFGGGLKKIRTKVCWSVFRVSKLIDSGKDGDDTLEASVVWRGDCVVPEQLHFGRGLGRGLVLDAGRDKLLI